MEGVAVAEVEVKAEAEEVEEVEVKLEGSELAKECLWLGDDEAMEDDVDLVCGPTSVYDSTGHR